MNKVVECLKAMSEIYGRPMSPAAAVMMAKDLGHFPEEQVLKALEECRRQLRYFPTIAEIFNRIKCLDGRPGVEEAWSMIPKDEAASVVWTEEMAGAFAAAGPLLHDGDHIAARMAFKEVYEREVEAARNEGRPAKWTATLGHDKAGRARALIEAQTKGRLSLEDVKRIMPEIEDFSVGQKRTALPAGATMGQIVSNVMKGLEHKK